MGSWHIPGVTTNCPRCRIQVRDDQKTCPNCGSTTNWNEYYGVLLFPVATAFVAGAFVVLIIDHWFGLGILQAVTTYFKESFPRVRR